MRRIHASIVVLAALVVVGLAWWLASPAGGNAVLARDAAPRAVEPGGATPLDAEREEPARDAPALGREELQASAGPSAGTEIAPALEEEEHPRLVGRVLRQDGTPAVGARVWASTSQSWIDLPLDVETDGPSLSGARVWTTETDAEGRFAFEAPDSGPVRITARACGHAPLRADGWLLEAEDERLDLGTLQLQTGSRVAGRLVGPGGAPVPDALVIDIGSTRGAGATWRLPRGPEVARTDGEGRFVVDELMPGPWRLLFEAPGYCVAEASGVLAAGASAPDLLVPLVFGETIEGQVLGVAADELEEWCVEARPAKEGDGTEEEEEEAEAADPWAEAGAAARKRVRRAFLEAEGEFHLDGLIRGGRYRLQLARRGAEGHWRRQPGPSRVERAGASGVELELPARAKLRCTVLNARDDTPIERMLVFFGHGAQLDDDGQPLTDFPGGLVELDLAASRPNAAPVPLRILAPDCVPYEHKGIVLHAKQELDLGILRLEPAAVLAVQVVRAEDERPLENALVVLSPKANEAMVQMLERSDERSLRTRRDLRWARTDSEGRASLAGFGEPSTNLIVLASGRRSHGPVVVPVGGDSPHVVRMTRGGSVLVRIRDPRARPVAGVGIEHKKPGEARFDEEGDNSFGWGRDPRSRTNAEGDLRFVGLQPGLHAFRVNETQQSGAFFFTEDTSNDQGPPWQEVPVVEGEERVLELQVPARGSLEGRVLQGSRALLEAAVRLSPRVDPNTTQGTYYFMPGASSPLATATDHEGRYRLPVVPEGDYDLIVSHPDRMIPAQIEVRVTAGANQLDVHLADVALEGRVVDREGTPLSDVVLRVQVQEERGSFRGFGSRTLLEEDDRGGLATHWTWDGTRSVRTGRDGRYRMDGLIDGAPLVVSASGDYVLPAATEALRLAPGELRSGVDFVLESAGALQVEYRGSDASGSWLFLVARLQTETEGESHEAQGVVSQWQKRSTLKGLRPGRWVVELRASDDEGEPGAVLETHAVDVQIGRTEKLAVGGG